MKGSGGGGQLRCKCNLLCSWKVCHAPQADSESWALGGGRRCSLNSQCLGVEQWEILRGPSQGLQSSFPG